MIDPIIRVVDPCRPLDIDLSRPLVLNGTRQLSRLLKVLCKVVCLFYFMQLDDKLCIPQREIGRIAET